MVFMLMRSMVLEKEDVQSIAYLYYTSWSIIILPAVKRCMCFLSISVKRLTLSCAMNFGLNYCKWSEWCNVEYSDVNVRTWCQCTNMSRQMYVGMGRNHMSLTLNWVYDRENACHRSSLPCTLMILRMYWAVLILYCMQTMQIYYR